ncbi:hypothetical protein ColTof4_11256 [Colletotrichum tofieldiae]|nr:hypothetical protein ColTof4_11256 [Colletotrichum tofieldiae]
MAEASIEDIQYAILSYCWGETNYKTTSENIEEHFVQIPLPKLPKTIQDAVEVTRALGLRYLWVDALCIQQDLGAEDIDERLKTMPEFYAGANIVIGAASASHSDAGFLAPRDTQYHEYELSLTLIDGSVTTNHRIYLLGRDSVKKPEPIDSRVWTYQEGENALCSLRFESERLEWKCQEAKLADSDIDLLSESPQNYIGM